MNDAEEFVQAFVDVWNERDPARRRATVRRLWAADGRHLMGAQDVCGHDALEERVAASNQRNVVEKEGSVVGSGMENHLGLAANPDRMVI